MKNALAVSSTSFFQPRPKANGIAHNTSFELFPLECLPVEHRDDGRGVAIDERIDDEKALSVIGRCVVISESARLLDIGGKQRLWRSRTQLSAGFAHVHRHDRPVGREIE